MIKLNTVIKKQKLLLVIIAILSIAFAGAYILQRNKIAGENINVTISDISGNPIKNTRVTFSSSNGIVCIQEESCPSINKSWNGKSDKNGKVLVPKDYFQEYQNYISAEEYNSAILNYKDLPNGYSVKLEKKDN